MAPAKQRAKDQIEAKADVPTFKEFIVQECNKVMPRLLIYLFARSKHYDPYMHGQRSFSLLC